MKVYVTVETFQGVVDNVEVHAVEGVADKCEQDWLISSGVENDEDRHGRAVNGTEFLIFECKLGD